MSFRTLPLASKLFIGGTIGANLYVFARWNTVRTKAPEGSLERQQAVNKHEKYMRDNYTLSLRNVSEGRYWTLLTSAFSHQQIGHMAVNMFVFYQGARFGTGMGIGPGRLAALCLGSGLAASAGQLYVDSTRRPSPARPGERVCLGASGIVEGLLVGTVMCYPKSPWHFMFIPVPVHGWLLVGAFVAWDMYNLSQEQKTGKSGSVAFASHLGGGAFGAAFYMLMLRRPFGMRYGGVLAPRR